MCALAILIQHHTTRLCSDIFQLQLSIGTLRVASGNQEEWVESE